MRVIIRRNALRIGVPPAVFAEPAAFQGVDRLAAVDERRYPPPSDDARRGDHGPHILAILNACSRPPGGWHNRDIGAHHNRSSTAYDHWGAISNKSII
jgi:hypothetical protein